MNDLVFLINEIYPCLQGEGVHLGVPSLLVRFQICNLRCVWCDTPYTHTIHSDSAAPNVQGNSSSFKISQQDLIQKIAQFNVKHIIFTGGEPTLQNIGILADTLRKMSGEYSFEVESNGTKIPHKTVKDFLESYYSLFHWNISPKLGSSKQKINNESISFWSEHSRNHENVYFKFVVKKENFDEDIQEILDLQSCFKIPTNKIILMPEGTTISSQVENVWLVQFCQDYSFRYSPRLHVLIYGDKRGV